MRLELPGVPKIAYPSESPARRSVETLLDERDGVDAHPARVHAASKATSRAEVRFIPDGLRSGRSLVRQTGHNRLRVTSPIGKRIRRPASSVAHTRVRPGFGTW